MRLKKRSLELLNFFDVFCFGDKYKSTGRELSLEWSHHRISSADSKVRLALQNSIKHFGSEGVKNRPCCF